MAGKPEENSPGFRQKGQKSQRLNLVFSEDFRLALEQIVGHKHILNLLKAQARDGVGEALLGLSVGFEEQQTLLNEGEDLLLVGENRVQRTAHGSTLAPTAAQINLVAGALGLDGLERTLLDAAAAVVALGIVNHGLAALHGDHMDGTLLITQLAALAQVGVDEGETLTHNANVVQIGA